MNLWLDSLMISSTVVICKLSLKYMITQENGKTLVNLLQYKTQIKGIFHVCFVVYSKKENCPKSYFTNNLNSFLEGMTKMKLRFEI